jgi:hypothetical protein
MRLSRIAIALGVTIGPALVLPLLTSAARAVQDQPVMIGGVETVCTGVGSAKDNPAWSAYPVKLVFADPSGANLAQVHLSVSQGGRPLVETECDAPWLLMKLPPGTYNVAATVPGSAGPRLGKASFATKGGAQQTVNVIIAAGP